MITALLPLTLLATSATAAMSTPQEIGFKQFLLGTELSALKKTTHMKCAARHDDVVECQILGKQTMLEKPVEFVSLHFANGGLGKVNVIVHPGRNAFHLVQHGTEVSGPRVF
jgi:hypothetical protein